MEGFRLGESIGTDILSRRIFNIAWIYIGSLNWLPFSIIDAKLVGNTSYRMENYCVRWSYRGENIMVGKDISEASLKLSTNPCL